MGGICRRCGASVKEDDKFCMVCGADLEKTRVDETQYRTQQTQQEHQEQQEQQTGGTWQKQAPKNTEEVLHKPLSFGEYLLLFLVLAIPILNIILLLVWSFSKEENTNRKNFARAALIYVVVISILQVFFFLWVVFFIAVSMENDVEYYVEEVIPPDKIEEFLPDAQNDLMIAFTSFEEEKRNVEIGIDGITIL